MDKDRKKMPKNVDRKMGWDGKQVRIVKKAKKTKATLLRE